MTDDDLLELERRRAEAFALLDRLEAQPFPTDLDDLVAYRDRIAEAMSDARRLAVAVAVIWQHLDLAVPAPRHRGPVVPVPVEALPTGYLD